MTSGMMKRNNLLRLLFIILLLFSGKLIAGDNGLVMVLKRLASVHEITAEFQEVKTYSLLNEEIKSEGQLDYIAPDILIKKTIRPAVEYFKVTGDTLYIKKADGEEHDLLLSNYPLVATFVEAYRGVLSGNIDKLRSYYEIDFSQQHKTIKDRTVLVWNMNLTPIDEEAQELIEVVRVEGIAANIHRIEIVESGGDKSVMQIKNQTFK